MINFLRTASILDSLECFKLADVLFERHQLAQGAIPEQGVTMQLKHDDIRMAA